jgi:hypothetical protein
LNKNHIRALTVMQRKHPPSDKAGPMGMQPIKHARSAPTQMLPRMPVATGKMKPDAKTPAPAETQPTRTEAVRAVLARITRRNSLRKQRAAQKS